MPQAPWRPKVRLVSRWLKAQMNRVNQRFRVNQFFLSESRLRFYDMLRTRDGSVPRDFSHLTAGGAPGLVSIVLPVYNGARYLSAAIDAVLNQSCADWELIVVDDGSTDRSGEIADAYAARDARIRCIHQENAKLPAALNTGHRAARGEFLTWTSDDNLLKPDFVAVLRDEMLRRPAVDFLFANMEVIDADGNIAGDAAYYRAYQSPPGSGVIELPPMTSRLHVWNSVGAAFLYRRRVLPLVGLYSENRFTIEDYDFWLRVNTEACMRHSEHRAPLYQYREHGESLTAAAAEAGTTARDAALLVFDDARRDRIAGPVAWVIAEDDSAAVSGLRAALDALIHARGDLLLDSAAAAARVLPVCRVYITAQSAPIPAESLPPGGVESAALVLYVGEGPLPCIANVDGCLGLCLGAPAALPDAAADAGWVAADDLPPLWHAMRARANTAYFRYMEAQIYSPPAPEYSLSIVICTNREAEIPGRLLRSLASQSFPAEHYEILLVNNAPEVRDYAGIAADYAAAGGRAPVRQINCYPPGLSMARNAGLYHAQGEVILYLDDDVALEADCLARLVKAFEDHPRAGVVGGTVALAPPVPQPWWYGKNLARFWSEFLPQETAFYTCADWRDFPVGALWAARRSALLAAGGFRTRYGRNSGAVPGGEEIVAALSVQRLGYEVAVAPEARVRHLVEAERFQLRGLVNNATGAFQSILLMQQEDRIAPILHVPTMVLRSLARLAYAAAPFPMPRARRVELVVLAISQLRCIPYLLRCHYRRLRTRSDEWRDASRS